MLESVVSSVRLTSKSTRTDAHRRSRPGPRHRVEQRAVDVDREGVAELVGLRLLGRLPAASGLRERMTTEALAAQPAEDVGQRPHAELARGAWRELEMAAVAVEVPRLLERTGQRGELVEVVDRIVAGKVAQRLGIDALERVRVACGDQRLLHRVVLLLAIDRGERIGQAHRLIALERIRLAVRQVGTGGLEVAGQSGHVDPQPVVAQQVVHQVAQLLAHLRAHAAEQRGHLRRLSMEMLDQLIGVLDARREVLPVLGHELVEVVGRIGTGGVLLEEPVQVADHVAHARQVLRRDPLDALLQPLEVRLQHLAAQLVGQGVEGVARLVVHELVVPQAVQAAGHVRRQRVEAVLALASRAPHDLLRHASLVLLVAGRGVECPLLGLVDAPLDAGTLRVQDALQPFVDVIEDAVEVRLAELLLPARSQPLEDPPQARDVAAARPAQAALHELLEGPTHVALGEDVLRERVEHVVRVEGGQLLAAVPTRVAEGAHRADQPRPMRLPRPRPAPPRRSRADRRGAPGSATLRHSSWR